MQQERTDWVQLRRGYLWLSDSAPTDDSDTIVLRTCRKAIAVIRCLHEAIVAAIGRATDSRDDRLV